MGHPTPLNYVGKFFPEDKYKILFVGIESYGGIELTKGETPQYNDFSNQRIGQLYYGFDDDEDIVLNRYRALDIIILVLFQLWGIIVP